MPSYSLVRTTEAGYFVLGAKSYGRLPTFLLRTGYAQVDEVVAALAAPAPRRLQIVRSGS